ncbi:MAG TPA: EthD family reductase [Bryobacteraceae bacterium]|nr:EthD family reductase [Bryobacteraceae bacterium]
MIRINVLYPNSAGATFDMDYYLGKHMPMVRERMGSALKGMSVEQGISGALPGSQPAYQVVTALGFESVEAFQAAFVPHASEIQGDIPRFTNVVPTIQISEVKL